MIIVSYGLKRGRRLRVPVGRHRGDARGPAEEVQGRNNNNNNVIICHRLIYGLSKLR